MKAHGFVPLLGLALALGIAAPGTAAAQDAAADSALMATGRSYVGWFLEGKTDTLFALFTPRMREAVPDAARFAAGNGQIRQLGPEQGVESENATRRGDLVVYNRVSRFATVKLNFVVATDAEGKIAGFGVRPVQGAVASRFLDYQTKTALRLPFDGDWFVFWGGRTQEQIYHVIAADQRFAYDILVMRDGKTHTGDGTRLEDYYCWGKPILAPGAGTVAIAVDNLDDHVPPQRDPSHAAGNHVIIDHGNGEYSLLAHLRKGSVAVRGGDRVEAGTKVGECGNSGNTSEPHLHYHLQNTGVFGQSEGLPAQFQGYVADGQPVTRGEPVKGQTIRPAAPR